MPNAPDVTDWPQRITARYFYDNDTSPEGVVHTEARVIANLAEKVHRCGGQFAAWPKVIHVEEEMYDGFRIEAEGWAIPR